MTKNIIQIIFDVASKQNIPTVIIGGLALPAYDVTRTTIDIDICIYANNQTDLDNFVEALKDSGIKTLQNPKVDHEVFMVFGANNEAEIWLQPCSMFKWDDQMIQKIRPFGHYTHVLAIEDFILTKLARHDRSSVDVDDIAQVIITNKDSIDWDYLYYRVNWIGIMEPFKDLLKIFKKDVDKNLRDISKDILDKFKSLN